nr:GNAT family N-acetyltransferase [Lachnospiraceae bacterium]
MIEVKETTAADLSNIQRLWADGDVMKFVGFPDGLVQSDEQMQNWFLRVSSLRPALNHYSIIEDGKYCGESFYEIDAEHRSAALDIKLFPFARGRGIATAGLSHAIGEAFRNGAETVWVDPNPENPKALALYKRLGFQQKDFPEQLISEGEESGSVYMELSRDSWPPVTLYERLAEVKDDAYREFQTKLVPNIPPETILGVRTPEMRRIAKEVFESPERESFLQALPHRYYEENLIHFFVIAMIRDFDACVRAVEAFLPYVDCWPVSDQSTPKTFRKNRQKLLPYIQKWIASEHVYTARFGIRMLMNEFLDEDFREEYPELVANKKGDDYYLKMMIAWYFATALAKRYDETVPYFEEHRLDDWVHKKAIQKALESYRVTDAHKEYLKSLR